MNFLKVSAAIALVMGLTGCYSNHSPKAVVASVGKSLKKDNFEVYQSMLSKKGHATIGGMDDFKALQAEVLKAKGKASLRSALLTDKGEYDTGRSTTHVVTISLDSEPVAKAHVSCLARRVWEQQTFCSSDGNGNHSCHSQMVPVIRNKCLIDSIKY